MRLIQTPSAAAQPHQTNIPGHAGRALRQGRVLQGRDHCQVVLERNLLCRESISASLSHQMGWRDWFSLSPSPASFPVPTQPQALMSSGDVNQLTRFCPAPHPGRAVGICPGRSVLPVALLLPGSISLLGITSCPCLLPAAAASSTILQLYPTPEPGHGRRLARRDCGYPSVLQDGLGIWKIHLPRPRLVSHHPGSAPKVKNLEDTL